MQTVNSLTPPELDAIIRNLPKSIIEPMLPPSKWQRVDVGTIETYVGDDIYVVSLVEKLPDSISDMTENQCNTEEVVIKYLKGEGFIGNEYAYIGMQRFNLQKPPQDFLGDN